MRVLAIVILMAIGLGATLMLTSQMTGYWWIEWLVLMAAGLFILAMFFGLWVDAEWAYPMATVLFALSLANMLWLYTKTYNFTVFAFGLLANIAGVVLSLTGIGAPEEKDEIETYDAKPVETEAVAKKRGRPKRRK